MKLSYNWLKDYLECDLTPQQIADAMTDIGIEVDAMKRSTTSAWSSPTRKEPMSM